MAVPRLVRSPVSIRATCAVVCALASALAFARAGAQRAAMTRDLPVAPVSPAHVAGDSTADVPFASSLQIVPPGPHAEADHMSYRMTLTWGTRPGAAAYRVFMWTDAVRAWYRTAQVPTTRVDVHAFKSGCTAFIVVAVADPNAGGNALLGLETTNVVRFPLSARPELCPVKGG